MKTPGLKRDSSVIHIAVGAFPQKLMEQAGQKCSKLNVPHRWSGFEDSLSLDESSK